MSGTIAAWALGMALIAARLAGAEAPAAQPQSGLTPAALLRADALIETYVQPIAAPAPTAEQKQAIETALRLLKSEQAMKGQSAIERFVAIGPAALGELRRLAAVAPAESSTGAGLTPDQYAATMAPIIIRRIETAQRQPLLDELFSLGDDARAVLSAKLNDNEDELTEAAERVEAATAALVKAAANTTVDAPALAGERRTLAEAQAAEQQVQARHDLLAELRRLLTPKPPPQPPAPPEEQQPPPIPPADVLDIQPISPPEGSYSYDDSQDLYLFGGGFDIGGIVNRYSHRGHESREEAHHGAGDDGRGKR
ncbi:MAG: hypothetical protein ACLQVA_12890 [Candidatus Brocadiia bacterium]